MSGLTLLHELQFHYHRSNYHNFLFASPSGGNDVNDVYKLVYESCMESDFTLEAQATDGDKSLCVLRSSNICKHKCPSEILEAIDAVVLIVSAGTTDRVLIQESIDYFKQHNIPLVGTVLNNTKHVIPNILYKFLRSCHVA
ncbi:MAG: hypothetical protein HRU15_20695 [Planctomycetes bacterium]|nr:hypothetical protein [Planctomycetota bacterium]